MRKRLSIEEKIKKKTEKEVPRKEFLRELPSAIMYFLISVSLFTFTLWVGDSLLNGVRIPLIEGFSYFGSLLILGCMLYPIYILMCLFNLKGSTLTFLFILYVAERWMDLLVISDFLPMVVLAILLALAQELIVYLALSSSSSTLRYIASGFQLPKND